MEFEVNVTNNNLNLIIYPCLYFLKSKGKPTRYQCRTLDPPTIHRIPNPPIRREKRLCRRRTCALHTFRYRPSHSLIYEVKDIAIRYNAVNHEFWFGGSFLNSPRLSRTICFPEVGLNARADIDTTLHKLEHRKDMNPWAAVSVRFKLELFETMAYKLTQPSISQR